MKKKVVFVIGLILLVIGFSISNQTEKPNNPPVVVQKTSVPAKEDDLIISKEKYDYYKGTFSNLSELQKQYEQIYAKFGAVDLETSQNIPKDAEFPQYGSITRRISTVQNSLPKFSTDMQTGEIFLLPKVTSYSSALILLTPVEDKLEGMDYVKESKIELQNGLEQIANFNKF